MFICTGCQKEYENQTKFCSECGGKVISKTATVQPAPVQPAAVQPVPGIDKKTVKKIRSNQLLPLLSRCWH